MKVKPLSEQEIYDKLLSCVDYSLKTDGYRWTFWKNAGGWMEVLKRYPIEKKGRTFKFAGVSQSVKILEIKRVLR